MHFFISKWGIWSVIYILFSFSQRWCSCRQYPVSAEAVFQRGITLLSWFSNLCSGSIIMPHPARIGPGGVSIPRMFQVWWRRRVVLAIWCVSLQLWWGLPLTEGLCFVGHQERWDMTTYVLAGCWTKRRVLELYWLWMFSAVRTALMMHSEHMGFSVLFMAIR